MAQIGGLNTSEFFKEGSSYIPIYGQLKAVSQIFGKTPAQENVEKQAQQQQLAAVKAYGQLQEQGRPEMSARRQRLESIYDIASQGLTGQQRQLAQQDIQRTQATALRDVSSLGGGLRGVGTIQGQSADSMQQLAATDANLAQQGMLSAGQMLAGAEGQAEQYNKLLPYEQLQQQYMAMLGASQQNQMLAANLQTQQGQQNLQMGMDVAGAGLGLAMGNPSALMGLAGGGGSPQLNANNRVATTGIPPTF
jgi:hypothetical protein